MMASTPIRFGSSDILTADSTSVSDIGAGTGPKEDVPMEDSVHVESVGKQDLICRLAASSTPVHVPPADISMREEVSHFLIVVSYGSELPL